MITGKQYCEMVISGCNLITNQKAAINALKDIQQRLGDSPIFSCIVYSDSAYLINCYQQGWYQTWEKNGFKNANKKPVANVELWAEIIPYFKRKSFYFHRC